MVVVWKCRKLSDCKAKFCRMFLALLLHLFAAREGHFRIRTWMGFVPVNKTVLIAWMVKTYISARGLIKLYTSLQNTSDNVRQTFMSVACSPINFLTLFEITIIIPIDVFFFNFPTFNIVNYININLTVSAMSITPIEKVSRNVIRFILTTCVHTYRICTSYVQFPALNRQCIHQISNRSYIMYTIWKKNNWLK